MVPAWVPNAGLWSGRSPTCTGSAACGSAGRYATTSTKRSSPSDECASEGEERFVDVVAYLPADPQAAEPVQVGERPLHNPALGTQAGTMLGAPACDDWLHAEVPDEPAVLVVVVAAVAEHHVRAAP